MSSEDLVAYLKERLADEEQLALAATPGPWTREWAFSTHFVVPHDAPTVAAGNVSRLKPSQRADAEHIAANDPARVLADIEAKRRLIDLHVNDGSATLPSCAVCDVGSHSCGCVGWDEWPCETLKILVQPYSSRPDFNEDWRTP